MKVGCCLVLCAVAPLGYADEQSEASTTKAHAVQQKTVEAVLAEHANRLMGLSGVVAVAQGDCGGEPCIKVYVAGSSTDSLEQLPGSIEGFAVVVEQSGEIRALE